MRPVLRGHVGRLTQQARRPARAGRCRCGRRRIGAVAHGRAGADRPGAWGRRAGAPAHRGRRCRAARARSRVCRRQIAGEPDRWSGEAAARATRALSSSDLPTPHAAVRTTRGRDAGQPRPAPRRPAGRLELGARRVLAVLAHPKIANVSGPAPNPSTAPCNSKSHSSCLGRRVSSSAKSRCSISPHAVPDQLRIDALRSRLKSGRRASHHLVTGLGRERARDAVVLRGAERDPDGAAGGPVARSTAGAMPPRSSAGAIRARAVEQLIAEVRIVTDSFGAISRTLGHLGLASRRTAPGSERPDAAGDRAARRSSSASQLVT